MKRIILLFCLWLFPLTVFADSSKASIVMDVSSGRILYSHNMHAKMLIASTTKIMTCIIVLENAELDKKITVGDEVLSMYGTNIYIEKGEVLTVKDLLYGLMLRSGNDAAVVLANHVFSNEKEFIKKMNEKAKKIGMKNTVFENPHGLDDNTKNYSTAYDMALLSKYAYSNKIYRKIISSRKYQTKSSLKSYTWYNRVSLFQHCRYCFGGKNGYTPRAGKSLVSVARKDNLILTIVSLDDSEIYINHTNLYRLYFKKYQSYLIIDKEKFYMNSSFYPGSVYLKKSFSYPLTSDEVKSVNTMIELTNLKKDKTVGKVFIKLNNHKIGEIPIYIKK